VVLLALALIGSVGAGVETPTGCGLGLPTPEGQSVRWTAPNSQRREPPFKGVELYSWEGLKGEQCFALLSGTNYAKSMIDVVQSGNTIVGVGDLGTAISMLAIDESITWWAPNPIRGISKSVRAAFRYPTATLLNAVLEEARKRGRHVDVLDRQSWDARIKWKGALR
jgi:hypothetical protein